MMPLGKCNDTGCHKNVNTTIADFVEVSPIANLSVVPLKVDQIFYTVASGTDNYNNDSIIPRVIEIFLSTVGVIFNGFLIIVIMSTPSLADVKTTKFILSLSISDLFVSGIVMAFSILIRLVPGITEEDDSNMVACWVWASVSMSACTASSLNVCIISIDRYLSISFPLHYENVITRFRINVALISVWTISFGMAFLTLYLGFGEKTTTLQVVEDVAGANHSDPLLLNSTYVTFINYCQELPSKIYILAIVTLIVLLPCLVVIIVYLDIFRLVTKQLRMIKKEQACAKRLTHIPHMRSHLSLLALHSSIMTDFGKIKQPGVQESSTEESITPPPKLKNMYTQRNDYMATRPAEADSDLNVRQQNVLPSSSSSSLKSAIINVYAGDEKQCQYIITEHHKIYFVGTSHDKDGTHSPGLFSTCRRDNLKSVFPKQNIVSRGRQSVAGQYILSLAKFPPKIPGLAEDRPSVVTAAMANISHRLSIIKNPEMKAAVILLVIAGTYVVCWLPFGIVSILQAYNSDLVSWSLREVCLWLAYSNSCWNPLIYALLNKTFRSSIYVFLAKHGCRSCLEYSSCSKEDRSSISDTSF